MYRPRTVYCRLYCSYRVLLLLDSVPKQEQKPPVQESAPTKPVQSVAPQAHEPTWESGTDNLVDLWGSSPAPAPNTSQSSNLVDLMGDADVLHDDFQPSPSAPSGRPQPLLSFDEMMDGTFCSGTSAEDNPSSLVDVTGSDQMTLSYQHALQHASDDGQELDNGELLMTNGETLLKEGTQVRFMLLIQKPLSFVSVSLIFLFFIRLLLFLGE